MFSEEAFLSGFWHLAPGSLGHHAKATLGYRHDGGASGAAAEHRWVVQTQLWF